MLETPDVGILQQLGVVVVDKSVEQNVQIRQGSAGQQGRDQECVGALGQESSRFRDGPRRLRSFPGLQPPTAKRLAGLPVGTGDPGGRAKPKILDTVLPRDAFAIKIIRIMLRGPPNPSKGSAARSTPPWSRLTAATWVGLQSRHKKGGFSSERLIVLCTGRRARITSQLLEVEIHRPEQTLLPTALSSASMLPGSSAPGL